MTPDQKEAAACLQDAETLLQKVKDARKHGPERFSADAQQQEHVRLHLAWELLLSIKAALIRADRKQTAGSEELWEKYRRLKAEERRLDNPVDERLEQQKKEARRKYAREWRKKNPDYYKTGKKVDT